MMRRKSPPSENILYLIENHCQTNISKGRRGKTNNFFMNGIKLYFVYMSLSHNKNILHYL